MFHVSANKLELGQALAPGHWGSRLRTIRGDTPKLEKPSIATLFWEMALEAARIGFDAELPSRLGCVFLAESREMATMFRDGFRPGATIYKVALLDDLPFHRGDFSLLTHDVPEEPLFDLMPTRANRYWSDEPKGVVELIYPGRVLIEEAI